MTRDTTKLSPAEYRQRLLKGMEAGLEEKPLADLTIADIARCSSVSKRTFYESFDDKESCFLDLYRSNAEKVIAGMRAIGEQIGAQDGLALREVASAYAQKIFRKARLSQRLWIDILGLGTRGLKVRREVNARYADLIAEHLQVRLRRRGVSTPIDQALVLTVVEGLNDLILYAIEEPDERSLAEMVRVCEKLLTHVFEDAVSSAPQRGATTPARRQPSKPATPRALKRRS